MNIPHAFSRAEYWWQPAQLARRAWRTLRRPPPGGRMQVRLPWGLPLTIDPHESIGRSILALNTLDLPVTEALWRLLDAGEKCADVGANLGYMTSVMAARLRQGGTVCSFEPLPELAARLRAHVAAWRGCSAAQCEVFELAVSDRAGTAELHMPAGLAMNHGTASLTAPAWASGVKRVPVRCATLDELFTDQEAPQVMKVDVEGCEARVFQGATRLLSRRRIRDIIFEELEPVPVESVRLMQAHRYEVYRIARTLWRPRLLPADAKPAGEVDPPSYLATTDPKRARARFEPAGWQSLS